MMNVNSIDMDDETQIFSKHMNPNSCLANLDLQRFATNLEEAQKGV